MLSAGRRPWRGATVDDDRTLTGVGGRGEITVYYQPPAQMSGPVAHLVWQAGTANERRFPFADRIVIGRYNGSKPRPGMLLVSDPTISSRHCVVTQPASGKFLVRDVSRNGTRVDTRRLMPNIEFDLQPGQTVQVGRKHKLRLEADSFVEIGEGGLSAGGTLATTKVTEVTVLVGDIREYTTLVRQAPSAVLQQSLSRVFLALEREVERRGGTVKEYQGDAVVAFWEEDWSASEPTHTLGACEAALALDALCRKLADDPKVWAVKEFPLKMDFALATGPVIFQQQSTGLGMLGEPIVLAFRIEKFADDDTGPIVACPETRRLATPAMRFDDLGVRQAKGFDKPDNIHALRGPRR